MKETITMLLKVASICLIFIIALYLATEIVKNIVILKKVDDDICFTINNKLYCDYDVNFVIQSSRGDV